MVVELRPQDLHLIPLLEGGVGDYCVVLRFKDWSEELERGLRELANSLAPYLRSWGFDPQEKSATYVLSNVTPQGVGSLLLNFFFGTAIGGIILAMLASLLFFKLAPEWLSMLVAVFGMMFLMKYLEGMGERR
ncbi:hypothetical protein J7L60_01920 [Candidatus Bathyarchaeota archaeon]|nr:hypothetical protein [Candidatus Bathyarchaeota archaeon]